MNPIIFASLLLLPLSGAAQSSAPVPPPGGAMHRGQTVTVQVKQFGDLENKLIAAIAAKDAEAVSQLLADNYVLRVGANLGDPTNRAEAIQQAMAGASFASRVENLAVLDEDHMAVVSFIWNLDVPSGDLHAKKIFVVDTWKQLGGSWKIVARYASAVDRVDALIPGYAPHALVPNKKI